MNKVIKYKFIQKINYADGTPSVVSNLEGVMALREDLPFPSSDKEKLIDWVQDQKQGDGEQRIDDFLFRYRHDPSHTRDKYKSIVHEVIDAWVVEYPC